jgi:hypothetical protein
MDPSGLWAKPELTNNTNKTAAIDRSMPANAGFSLRVVQTIFIRSTVLPQPGHDSSSAANGPRRWLTSLSTEKADVGVAR